MTPRKLENPRCEPNPQCQAATRHFGIRLAWQQNAGTPPYGREGRYYRGKVPHRLRLSKGARACLGEGKDMRGTTL